MELFNFELSFGQYHSLARIFITLIFICFSFRDAKLQGNLNPPYCDNQCLLLFKLPVPSVILLNGIHRRNFVKVNKTAAPIASTRECGLKGGVFE
jgi:hypothetical protein